jgi:hypothetical protein
MSFGQIGHKAMLLGGQLRIGFSRCFRFTISLFFSLSFFPETSAYADPIDWPTLGSTQVVANTFSHPTVITHAGDGSGRLFVVEQSGRIWIVQSNSVLTQPFLDITSRVLSAGAEQGLLGLAFPSGFSSNNRFYVNYTRQTDGATVISRFHLTAPNSNVADTNGEEIVKVISQPFNNHNGGQIAFGPDSDLYVGVGDGGSEGDPQNIGQKKNTLLGKLLRIDVESGASPYAVPANNPFVGNPSYLPEIWALGLRNPWRFSFDRLTGDLYIGDVGQNRFEEIDFQLAGSAGGQNYGWRIVEGPTNYNVPTGFTNFSTLTGPATWYDHLSLPTDLTGSVTGGYVYRGPSALRMDGVYFYGDFMAGWIWGSKQVGTNWQSFPLLKPAPPASHFMISTFGEDDQGQLYLADYYAGKIYQIQDSLQVWTPTFFPTNGIISSNIVVVSCVTTGAVIHYTSNGIDPTTSDPVITSGGTIQVTTGQTNKLRAFRPDLTVSAVARAIFTNKVAALVFSPPASAVTNGTLVTISTITPGATIYYTTNGSTPTTSSFLYSSPIAITKSVTLKAFGAESGYSNTAVATVSYSIAQVATPAFIPDSGPYTPGLAIITNRTSISMSCSTPASTIYYTLDGSAPNTNSTVYSMPVIINGGTTVNAFAVANAYDNSSVRSIFYQLVQTATPIFTPPSGPITNGTQIIITCSTPDSMVYYTLDGSIPTTNPLVCNGSMIINGSNGGVNLNVIAMANGYLDSVVVNIFYGLLSLEKTVVTTLAGNPSAGFTNAAGSLAMFSNPQGICIDQAGNLYVADTGNSVIRRIAQSGLVTTFAGTGIPGSQVGVTTNAQFARPTGIGVDHAGNFYVADGNNCNRVCKIDTNGIVSELAEIYGDCIHAPGLWQLVADPSGNVYVGSWASVQKITPDGTVIGLAGPHWCCPDGWGPNVGPGIDAAANIYAATANTIWKITPDGTTDLFAGGFGGFSDGPQMSSLFQSPQAIFVDALTNVYVSDTLRIRKIDFNGWVSTMAGSAVVGYQNGRGSVAQFSNATGLCMDTNENIYVADSGNNCIRKISPDTFGIGIADDWQRMHFGYVGIDPNADPDHDGMSNYAEFWSGTDPLDSSSVLAIDRTSFVSGGYTQTRWQTVPGKTYAVQYSIDLISWTNLGNLVQGDGSIATVNDPSPIQQNTRRFYRIVVVGY